MVNYELRTANYKSAVVKILYVLCVLCSAMFSATAQSTNQSYPTAVTSNEITGRIAARDVGDARLTDYFYTFSGAQGDVFINVQTSNFNGDIDIFTHGNLKPLTKITVYADDTNRETGRVIYLRQPAKLLLRVEGRSPNDDAATFTIKFAGSFVPAQTVAENTAPDAPEVKSENQTDVRVNSVGTILEIKPKPQPSPKETIAKNAERPRNRKSKNNSDVKSEKSENKENAADESKKIEETKENAKENPTEETSEVPEKKSDPVVATTENEVKETSSNTNVENPTAEKAVREEKSAEDEPVKDISNPASKTPAAARKRAKSRGAAKKVEKVKAPNPLENVRLIILLKDGTLIERQMSEVLRVGVVRGVLTVTAADGSIKRYPILDVAKMTIE